MNSFVTHRQMMYTLSEWTKAVMWIKTAHEQLSHLEWLIEFIKVNEVHGKRYAKSLGELMLQTRKSHFAFQERKMRLTTSGLSFEDVDYHNRKLDEFTAMKPNCKLQALPVPECGDVWEQLSDTADTTDPDTWTPRKCHHVTQA